MVFFGPVIHQTMPTAIYAFSGDPITYGHLDIIERALRLFGRLVVGIGKNPAKKYLFSLEERVELARQALQHLPDVEVVGFQGLLFDYAYEQGISTIVRGIRNSEDLTYEVMLYQVGDSQQAQIDTVFLPAKQALQHVSSGAVKALQLEQGLIHEYVPPLAKQRLEERLSGQYHLAITGEIGVGKSYVTRQLAALADAEGIATHIVDVDQIGHAILGDLSLPLYRDFRTEVARIFGAALLLPSGAIDRSALGQLIFADRDQLQQFNRLIYQPLLLQLRRQLYGKRGLVLLDTALIAESEMSYLSNYHTVLVGAATEVQRQRLYKRGYTPQQLQQRLQSQYGHALKQTLLEERITDTQHGHLWQLDNSETGNHAAIAALWKQLQDYFGLFSKV